MMENDPSLQKCLTKVMKVWLKSPKELRKGTGIMVEVFETNNYLCPIRAFKKSILARQHFVDKNQKGLINSKKTKLIDSIYTKTSVLILENQAVEEVSEVKLLGTIITNDLKLDRNSGEIFEKIKFQNEDAEKTLSLQYQSQLFEDHLHPFCGGT